MRVRIRRSGLATVARLASAAVAPATAAVAAVAAGGFAVAGAAARRAVQVAIVAPGIVVVLLVFSRPAHAATAAPSATAPLPATATPGTATATPGTGTATLGTATAGRRTATAATATAPGTPSVSAPQKNFLRASTLDQETWSRIGQPDRLIIVRATSVDVVQNGTLVTHTLRAGGIVTISWLAGALGGSGWISMPSQDTAVLSAALLLSSGTNMQIGPDVRRLLLIGGTAPASASWIRCGHASLTMSGVALSSLRARNDADWRPVPASWAGRPYLYAAAGGRLDVFGSTISDLGRPQPPQPAGSPWSATPRSATPTRSPPVPGVVGVAGVTWGKGSTGSAVNARFERNQVGLLLGGSVGVRLSHVTVENAVLDGLMLRGDRATTLREVVSRSNGGSGVIISGPGTRHVAGLSATGNAASGVKAITQTGLVMTGVRTAADMGGGVRLVGCVRCTVNDLGAVGDNRAALTISGASHDVSVIGAHLNGGQTGITVTAGTRAVTLRNAVVTGFNRLGVEIAATDVRLLSSQISGSPVGVGVYGPAARIQLSGVTVRGGRDGVTVTRTADAVSLSGVTVIGVSHNGVKSASAGLRMSGGHISGGHIGIALLAPAAIVGVDIDSVVTGIHVRSGVKAKASRVDVLAERDGIKAEVRARVDLSDALIRAPIALAGAGYISRDSLTVLSLPPTPWLGFAAIAAVLLAIILQTVHQLRHRKYPRAAGRPACPQHRRHRKYPSAAGRPARPQHGTTGLSTRGEPL
jgi:hypothetical protein